MLSKKTLYQKFGRKKKQKVQFTVADLSLITPILGLIVRNSVHLSLYLAVSGVDGQWTL